MEEIIRDYYMNSYLSHHGILGQKWGVRRFQNPDGTLTSAGKKRYKIDYDNGIAPERNKPPKNAKVDGVTNSRGIPKGAMSLAGGQVKVGLGRYQNKDGTLTEEGQKRYERDVRENKAKKKDNRIDTSQPDPNRWVQEDLNRTKNVIDASSRLVNDIEKMEDRTSSKKTQKMDLSKMSDKELRDQINRKLLEQQYERLCSDLDPDNVSKGKERVKDVLEMTGLVLGVTGSAVTLAVEIKKLMG